MLRKKLLLVLLSPFILGTNAYAEVSLIPAESDLVADRVRLDFERYRKDAFGADLFGKWGVQFRSTGSGNIQLDTIVLALIGREIGLLKHESEEAAGLAINFKEPLEEVAFHLRGEPETVARITAFDDLGNNLGFVERTAFNSDGDTFFGIRSSDASGITKIILDYGDSEEPEKIVELFFTFLNRQPFLTYLAQVADGKLPSGALSTTIIVANLSNTTALGELRVFGDDGTPLEFEFVGGTKRSTVPLSVVANASRKLVTSGTGSPPAQGYMEIETDVPVEATAIFQILDDEGTPLSEAGVGGSSGVHTQTAAVSKEAGKQFDSGIAVINVGTQPATGVVQLIRQDGRPEASNSDFLELGPGEHDADFLDQMFPAFFNRDFDGTLVIQSDQPVAMVVLRTIRGLVLSSLPVGTLEQ